ncbi:MAG: hypothetical protein HON90_03550 [Halobacteriovoraceae bacterium]|jgi:acyl-lipid omega-6 desaturase (Delta-12 desaturase)|nr:hypothetical protein [Halobacteriovoraceae bacterium]
MNTNKQYSFQVQTEVLTQNLRALLSISTISFMAIASIYLISDTNYLIKALGVVILNLQIWAWFSIMHSCGHGAYFTSKRLNTLIGFIASLFCFIPFHSWQDFHNTHHLWTGHFDKDPTAPFIGDFKKSDIRLLNILWKYWFPILSLSHTFTHLWNYKAYLKLFKKEQRNAKLKKFLASCLFIIFFHIVLGSSIGISNYLLVLAGLLLFLISADTVLTSQHSMIPMKEVSAQSRPLHTSKHGQYTRSICFGKLINQYILLNFNEHHKHHRHPLIPHFYLNQMKENEQDERVDALEWSKRIRSTHLRDILVSVKEGKNE